MQWAHCGILCLRYHRRRFCSRNVVSPDFLEVMFSQYRVVVDDTFREQFQQCSRGCFHFCIWHRVYSSGVVPDRLDALHPQRFQPRETCDQDRGHGVSSSMRRVSSCVEVEVELPRALLLPRCGYEIFCFAVFCFLWVLRRRATWLLADRSGLPMLVRPLLEIIRRKGLHTFNISCQLERTTSLLLYSINTNSPHDCCDVPGRATPMRDPWTRSGFNLLPVSRCRHATPGLNLLPVLPRRHATLGLSLLPAFRYGALG